MRKDRYDTLAEQFLEFQFPEGKIIDHSVFWKLFSIPEPQGVGSAKDFQKLSYRFMSTMDGFKRALLRRGHDLQNVRAKGYRLVPYQDRPKAAYEDVSHGISKNVSSGISRMNAIPNPEQLTMEARALRDKGLTTFGHIRAILRARQPKTADEPKTEVF